MSKSNSSVYVTPSPKQPEQPMTENQKLRCCPECDSAEVAVTEETKWMVNTGDHYCHSIKAHDSDAKVTCLKCKWEGQRQQLITKTKATT